MNFRNKTKVSNGKNSYGNSLIISCFEHTKKTFTHQRIKPQNNQKMLDQHLSGKNNKNFRSEGLTFFFFFKTRKN